MSGKSDKAKADWKTATQYHLCHALAIATLPAYQGTPARAAAGLFFSTGITLFSGSVYYACEYAAKLACTCVLRPTLKGGLVGLAPSFPRPVRRLPVFVHPCMLLHICTHMRMCMER